jgi:hypothetical protein
MPDQRLARCLFVCAVLLAPGCQAFYSYRPVAVLVRDAETKKAIPGAEVRISYPMTKPSVAPWDSVEVSGEDGIAHLRAAPSGESGLRLQGTARDYLPESINVPVEAIAEIPPSVPLLPEHRRTVNFTLELSAGPNPSVELVLPRDFRGLITAVVEIHDDEPCPPRKRSFTYKVDSKGDVLVSGPSLLRKVLTPDFHARYAGGPELSKEPDPFEVRFRPLQADVDRQFFVVGTQSDFDAYRRLAEKASAEPVPAAKSDQDGSQQRRHRRGGPASSPQEAPRNSS